MGLGGDAERAVRQIQADGIDVNLERIDTLVRAGAIEVVNIGDRIRFAVEPGLYALCHRLNGEG